jgi:hypothetical protein
MQLLRTERDVQSARSQPRALVFLWVEWSIQARHSERVLAAFLKTWASDMPHCPIPAYRADLSDQSGGVWDAVRGWLVAEGQEPDALTFGGNGALLWVRNGAITTAEASLVGVDAERLSATCTTLCGNVVQ